MGRVLSLVYVVFGFMFLGLAFLGAFLPLVPSTPFALLAAYFFSKGHPPFYRCLIALPQIGPAICAWNQHGVIHRRFKVVAVGGLLGVSLFLWFKDVPLSLKLLSYGIFVGVISFIISRPESERPLQGENFPGT